MLRAQKVREKKFAYTEKIMNTVFVNLLQNKCLFTYLIKYILLLNSKYFLFDY